MIGEPTDGTGERVHGRGESPGVPFASVLLDTGDGGAFDLGIDGDIKSPQHVFVASDNVAEKRAVTLGLEEGEYVEALSGVAAGETVIVAGQGGLKDGSPVKVLADQQSTS